MMFAVSMLIALVIDAAIGWPDALYRRLGHPVTWIGALIARLETRWNRAGTGRKWRGVATFAVVVAAAALPAYAITLALPDGWIGAVVAGVLAWPLVAARAMYTHVAAVARPLEAGDLGAARRAVSMIVGRDPAQLDSAGIARAALESLAENTSDGIIAPLFWGAILGLPGIAAYKAINTLDSMIGHKTPRYQDFGWFSARADDWVNLIPARLTGVLFALTSAHPLRALRTMRRDARAHRSPNAGWPEAAMAGALNIRLSGPRVYENDVAQEPWLNGGARDPSCADIGAGLRLYIRALALMAALMAALLACASVLA
ncbi:MAG: adenosylcobinamide-phosphate synthase CbiB [Cypionkella sp.]|nr:adenosylcobinamide-phosphate synthase CbiB [Cypionkella sp.]